MEIFPLLPFISLICAVPSILSSKDIIPRSSGPSIFGVYIQSFHQKHSSDPLDFTQLIGTGITHVWLATFHLNADSPPSIHLNDADPEDSSFTNVWAQVAKLQDSGIKVIATVGGAAHGSFQALCGDFSTYYNLLSNTVKTHSLDGIELNIEEVVDISCINTLIHQIYSDHGSSFIITLCPIASGLTSSSTAEGLSLINYFDLDKLAVVSGSASGSEIKLISWFNAQCYNNFGTAYDTGTYDSIMAAGWEPSRVVMSALDSSKDALGWVSVTDVANTAASLKGKYTGFAGVTGWEFFDAGTGDNISPLKWVQTVWDKIRD